MPEELKTVRFEEEPEGKKPNGGLRGLHLILGVLASLLLAVLISLLVANNWVQEAKDQIQQTRTELVDAKKALGDELAALKADNNTLKDKLVVLQREKDELVQAKERLEKNLEVAQGELKKAADQLGSISRSLDDFQKTQKDQDATQNKDIADVSRRMHYVEEKIKKLDVIEKDVMSLKDDTGNLKGQYVALKGDLQKVREKGDVTEQELTDLTERSRLFQLRVLAARAREAAEAARKGDIRKLLTSLQD